MRGEDCFREGINLKSKGSLRFNFIQSRFGVISGVAYREGEGIVASFKLQVRENGVYSGADPRDIVELKMVFGPSGREVRDIFDDVLSRYGKSSYQVVNEGYVLSCWIMPHSRAGKAMEEIRQALSQVTSHLRGG